MRVSIQLFSCLSVVALLAPMLMMTSCSAGQTEHALHMADAQELPAEMQHADPRTTDAYRFAVANPEPLKNVPCFCGCAAVGHTSNYDCYIADAPNNGKLVFESHALGCQICVDITQDVMRMTAEGRAPPQIQRTIINTYSQFGPSNFPD